MFLFLYLFIIFAPLFPLYAVTKEDISITPHLTNRLEKRKGALALTAIFRDEAEWLQEWIEYHRLVGVSHFYLYNNCSSDHFWQVLQPYVNEGIVELFDVPFDSYAYNDGAKTHNLVQVTCYNHAIALASDSNDWLAIIDADEFICPVVDKDIPSALARYGQAGGLVVYWQIYGTSNVWELNPGELMIEKLLYKQPNEGSGLFKIIVRPLHAKCVDPHWTKVTRGTLVMPNHRPFSHRAPFKELPIDTIRINHYTFRIESYYHHVKCLRRERWGDRPSPEEKQSRLNKANQVYDPVMLRFVPALKKRLKLERKKEKNQPKDDQGDGNAAHEPHF